MAPFDATFIQDETIQAAVLRGGYVPYTNDEALNGRFSLSVDAALKSPISYAELEEVLTAPAMRTTSYTEYLLQRLDRYGVLTSGLFITVYAVLMNAL